MSDILSNSAPIYSLSPSLICVIENFPSNHKVICKGCDKEVLARNLKLRHSQCLQGVPSSVFHPQPEPEREVDADEVSVREVQEAGFAHVLEHHTEAEIAERDLQEARSRDIAHYQALIAEEAEKQAAQRLQEEQRCRETV